MTRQLSRLGFTPREHRVSVLPSTIATLLVLGIGVWSGVTFLGLPNAKSIWLIGAGVAGAAYLVIFNLWIIPSPGFKTAYAWINTFLSLLGLVIITYILPEALEFVAGFLLILAVVTNSTVADRAPTYVLIGAVTLMSIWIRGAWKSPVQWVPQAGFSLLALITAETIWQLKNLSRRHIRQLETITTFSRNISSTLNTRQVMALLNAAFQNAVEADTYFVGLRDGDRMRLELVYDDGEYFENQSVQLEGSLSSWVLANQRSLFLPDLRREVDLPGVRLVLVGKHKTSLSWMGVPMRSEKIDGLIAIGSYRPNAFDRGDLELLSTLAQHAAQVLENSRQHEQVELRSQLDSLTGLYNHGNFLKQLQSQADAGSASGQPVCLIMLDVDHFKQYNDSYGHLVGDEVLTSLSETLRQHVKSTDCVGRWGGEEFVISLPNASLAQAQQVAVRIRDTMMANTIHTQDKAPIQLPTVSQGIAIFPLEASNLVELIHLADRRLYVAKSRGRNQIEPDPGPAIQSAKDRVETTTEPPATVAPS